MEQQIDAAVKRGRAYWFADGFSELILGAFFLLLGSAVLLRVWAGQGAFLEGFATTAIDFAVLKGVALLAAFLAIWWLKDRFTYPRTGYVRGKSVPPLVLLTVIRNLILIALLPVLGLISGLLFVPQTRAVLAYLPAGLPVAIGALWGALAYFGGEWLGLRRFRLLGWLMLLAGAAVGLWQISYGLSELPAEVLQWSILDPLPDALQYPLDEWFIRMLTGMGILTLATGAGFAVTGAMTFFRYRKENPAPYREES
ncbi:MAG: hypothetical protein ACK2UB_04960 [Anaerolineales bacterium]